MGFTSLRRAKVYDGFLRLIHAWNGVVSLSLLISGWIAQNSEVGQFRDGLWHLHIRAGYLLAGGLGARLIWGVFGPRHAKWSALWHPRTWLEVLRTRKASAPSRFGHDPFASLAYLGVYATLAIQVLTGFLLGGIEHGRGPLAESWYDEMAWQPLLLSTHEVAAYFIAAFVLVHLVAMALHEAREKRPIVQSMFSGFQYIRKENP